MKTKKTRRWVQSFCELFQIVQRSLSGKIKVSPAKEDLIEREVAYHLGQIQRQFMKGQFDEEKVENADETYFRVNMDSGKELGFMGSDEVEWADVVSGVEGMKMAVSL